MLLFIIFILRGLTIAGRARDDFGTLLSVGCISIIFWHVAINVAMVMGVAPVVGVPLSFVSYGGSSLLLSFLVTAILTSVSARRFLLSSATLKEVIEIEFPHGYRNLINFLEFMQKTETIFNYLLKLISGCVKEWATGL